MAWSPQHPQHLRKGWAVSTWWHGMGRGMGACWMLACVLSLSSAILPPRVLISAQSCAGFWKYKTDQVLPLSCVGSSDLQHRVACLVGETVTQ